MALFKLYKRDGNALLYHEAWSNGRTVVEHWGVCGDEGQTKDHRVTDDSDKNKTLLAIKKSAAAKGYKTIPESKMVFLVIEYAIEGNGTPADLARRYALEKKFNELVGWLGLGHVDGGSIGSGTMEVALRVVNFNIAKAAIEAKTTGTRLAGFTRINRE